MTSLLPYLISALVGAAGGWLGDMLKKNGLGVIGNLVAGAAGGSALTFVASSMGFFQPSSTGGLDMIGLAASLVGGGAGSLLGGMLKKA